MSFINKGEFPEHDLNVILDRTWRYFKQSHFDDFEKLYPPVIHNSIRRIYIPYVIGTYRPKDVQQYKDQVFG